MLGLFAAIGCGTGSTNIIHTTGNYSNASLNGTYVYEIHGDSLGGFYREIGAFTAASCSETLGARRARGRLSVEVVHLRVD